jgi:hypothetical protein
MDKNLVMTIVLIVLIGISGVQAIELNNMDSGASSDDSTAYNSNVVTKEPPKQQAYSGMVGGC